MFKIIICSAIVFAMMPVMVYGCSVAPRESIGDHVDLVKRTKRIVLAKVIDVNDLGVGHRKYRFETIETLKGEKERFFNLEVKAPLTPDVGYSKSDFDSHQDLAYWDFHKSRAVIFPDCDVYPYFEYGGAYLLFRDKPYHVQGFEKIRYRNDKWLLAIRNVLQDPSRPSGLEMDATEYLAMAKSVYLYKCPEKPHHKNFSVVERLFGVEILSHNFTSRPDSKLYGVSCAGTGLEFVSLYYHGDSDDPQAFPVIDGKVDFSILSLTRPLRGSDIHLNRSVVPFDQLKESLHKMSGVEKSGRRD